MSNNKFNKLINEIDENIIFKFFQRLKKIDKQQIYNKFNKVDYPLKYENSNLTIKKRKRIFSDKQRKILLILSGNICSMCKIPLKSNFHADHVIPYSKGGNTILNSGQAVCKTCNLKKGSKYEKNRTNK